MRRLERLLATFDAIGAGPAPIRGQHYINPKDLHVAEAALGAEALAIITLDKRFAREVSRSGLPVVAIDPGTFIRTELQTHPDFPFGHH